MRIINFDYVTRAVKLDNEDCPVATDELNWRNSLLKQINSNKAERKSFNVKNLSLI